MIGFPGVNILESYVRMIDKYNKNFIIGGYVTEENFMDYLDAFQMRKFEITSSERLQINETFNNYNGSLIWMDNFDKVYTPHYFTDEDDSNFDRVC